MKVRKILIYLFSLVLVTACERWDQIESRYDNFHGAKPAIRSGWVPEYLPESAESILEVHNIDTSETQLMASISLGSMASLSAVCKSVDNSAVDYPLSGIRPWWPKDLTRDGESSRRSKNERWRLFLCGEYEFVAINISESTFYFWRLGSLLRR
jgi:hypothetical protein